MKKSDETKENGIPRILIAAEKSGCGKTTFTCGLLQVLLNRGIKPVSFKCGPDYIDPLFHERVLGIESNNLDSYFLDGEGIRSVLANSFSENFSRMDAFEEGNEERKSNDNVVAVIEGVMGLYDGLSPVSNTGSCYEIAEITNTKIILLVDASGVGRTLISRIRGILSDDEKGLICGVILNRISEGYYGKIKPVIEEELHKSGFDTKVFGFLPKAEEIALDSRHLGLILPGEVTDIKERIEKTASLIEADCDVEGILNVMSVGAWGAGTGSRTNPALSKEDEPSLKTEEKGILEATEKNETADENREPGKAEESKQLVESEESGMTEATGSITLAVARDEAFCFYYRENLRLFEECGVKIRYFSPIHDAAIPQDADGILLGGGYPENHAEALSGNSSMLESVKNAIAAGMPSLAECGGFLYLHKDLTTREGKKYPMAGVIDASAEYTSRSVRFGYLEVKSCKKREFQSLEGIRGHEFHYFESSKNGDDCILRKASTGKEYESLIVGERSVWGFAHLYYASKPEFVSEFTEMMKSYRKKDGVPLKKKTANSAKFFANHSCEYYPCHKCNTEINCLFCYCPLYHTDCPGNFTMKESGGNLIKNCKDCVFPHLPQNYEKVMEILKEKSRKTQ